VSRLGSPTHQQTSAAGDTVNVASRLLEVAKQQACRIVVSEDVVEAARALAAGAIDLPAYTPMTVPIRGHAAPLRVRIRS
jgi:adenylate cyclase